MNNPYNKHKEEQLYLSWDHAFNAESKEDNPYNQDDGKVYTAWMQGWNSKGGKKKQSKAPVVEEEDDPYYEDTLAANPTSVISTEELIKELKQRTAKELQDLLLQRTELDIKIIKLQSIQEL